MLTAVETTAINTSRTVGLEKSLRLLGTGGPTVAVSCTLQSTFENRYLSFASSALVLAVDPAVKWFFACSDLLGRVLPLKIDFGTVMVVGTPMVTCSAPTRRASILIGTGRH